MVGRPRAAPFCSMHMHHARPPISCRQCKISAAINSRGYRAHSSSPLLSSPLAIDGGAAVLNTLENYGSPEKAMNDAETKTRRPERPIARDLV